MDSSGRCYLTVGFCFRIQPDFADWWAAFLHRSQWVMHGVNGTLGYRSEPDAPKLVWCSRYSLSQEAIL